MRFVQLALMVAVSVFFGMAAGSYAVSRDSEATVPRYQMAPIGVAGVWRLDTITGDLSLCFRKSKETAPECGPWGSASPIPSAAPTAQRKVTDEEFKAIMERAAKLKPNVADR